MGYSSWGCKESGTTEQLTLMDLKCWKEGWFLEWNLLVGCDVTHDPPFTICLQCVRPGFNPWVGKIPWRREWQPTPVLLPRKFHGRGSLVG